MVAPGQHGSCEHVELALCVWHECFTDPSFEADETCHACQSLQRLQSLGVVFVVFWTGSAYTTLET